MSDDRAAWPGWQDWRGWRLQDRARDEIGRLGLDADAIRLVELSLARVMRRDDPAFKYSPAAPPVSLALDDAAHVRIAPTPQTQRGVYGEAQADQGTPIAAANISATPQTHEGHPPNPAAPPPLSVLDEYSNQSPKGEFTKGERGGTAGRKCHPLPPVDSKGALRDGAGGKASAASGSKASAAKAEDWRTTARADPHDVLLRMKAAGGREAERLAAMSDAEALAAIEHHQRIMRGR